MVLTTCRYFSYFYHPAWTTTKNRIQSHKIKHNKRKFTNHFNWSLDTLGQYFNSLPETCRLWRVAILRTAALRQTNLSTITKTTSTCWLAQYAPIWDLFFIQQFTKRNNAAFIFCFQLTLIYNKTNISTKLMKLLRLALCFNYYLILLIMSLFINYDLRLCMVYF